MFKKAERTQSKLKVGLIGPSGSGKTYSALLLAFGIGKKIAVIDTENGSASLYAHLIEFDTLTLNAPYTTDKYLAAMQIAEKEGYDVVIVDSASHQWAGRGGVQERKLQTDAEGGNSFTNWSKYTPEHNRFINAIIQHKTHLICTVRSKEEYALSMNDRGKQVPQKMGLAPIQRDGFAYEFTTIFDIDSNHMAKASKDRTEIFQDTSFKISQETGVAMMNWLLLAKPEAKDAAPLLCDLCGSVASLHSSGRGYICPQWSANAPNHLKVATN